MPIEEYKKLHDFISNFCGSNDLVHIWIFFFKTYCIYEVTEAIFNQQDL